MRTAKLQSFMILLKVEALTGHLIPFLGRVYLTQGEKNYAMHGQNGSNLNTGKNLVFSGAEGYINLKNDVHQGAGSLTFKDNYTVASESGSIWTGAGLIVEKDAIVTWKVNGENGDALHKIGEGTLYINGNGINPGNIRVGDGTVILSQRPDVNGNTQAFNKLTITSGRPTVVLADAHQLKPDNIYFGYKGGRLDVNGIDLIFNRIKMRIQVLISLIIKTLQQL